MVMEKNAWFLRWGSIQLFRANACFLAFTVLLYFFHDAVVSRLPISHF